MDETELLRRLRDEEADATSYHSSELAKDQASNLQRYFGQPFGNEKPDRSQVVTPDVMDGVNWAIPGLLRPFLSSEDFLTIDTKVDFDTSVVADYLSHVFFVDNPGQQNLHDYAFDGLVSRVGVMDICWADAEMKPPREMEGVSPAQIVKYNEDPEYNILGVEQADNGTVSVTLQHTPRMGRVKVICRAPEDFRIARRSASLAEAPYYAIIHRDQLLSDIFNQYPDKQAEIENACSDDTSEDDTRIAVRFAGEATRSVRDTSSDVGRGRVDLMQEYVRGDFDGDGAEELRAIKRVGSVILENIVIDEPEASIWSPIKISHRAIGLSLADTIIPYQKIRTEITRRALDNMAQVLIPQKVISLDALDQGEGGVNMQSVQALINGAIGATALVRGKANEAVSHIVTPDVSASAMAGLEYFDQRKQEASGVTAHMQGADAQKLHDTAQGVDLIQSAGNARIEMMARWYAEGLEAVFNRILKLICQHQDQPRMVKLRGKPMEINPANWPDDMMVRVHVGMASSSRERQIANLSNILAAQKEVMIQMGPSNPIVSLTEMRNTLARLVESMGYKDAAAFFKEVPKEFQPPAPGKDPKTLEVEQKGQLAAQELQTRTQLQSAELQSKQQMAQLEFEHKTQMAEMQATLDAQIAAQKSQTEQQVAALKAANEFKIAQLRIASETEIARERMNAEMKLSGWKAAQDVKVKKQAVNSRAKKPNGNGVDGDGVRFGGQIG